MDIRRVVPEVVQRILAVGGEDVYSISLVVTGGEPYFLVGVSGDNAATVIARRLWPDLPAAEVMYYLTVEGRVPALREGNDDEVVSIVVTTDPTAVLWRDLRNDDATYRRVYTTEDARVPDHAQLAADLRRVAQVLTATGGETLVEVLAAVHPAVVRWAAEEIFPALSDGRGDVVADILKPIANNVLQWAI